MKKKGIALVLAFAVIMILAVLGSIIISRSINESQLAKRYAESSQAFWLAEAGINRALKELKDSYIITGSDLWSTTVDLDQNTGDGKYSVSVEDITIDSQPHKKVTARGGIPSTGTARAERVVEAIMSKYIPNNFYDNAVYSAGTVDFNGNSYIVANNEVPPDNKAVLYGGDFEVQNPGNITGTTTHDPSINPLALLDFEQLHDISTTQQNVYVKSGNKLINESTGLEGFPTKFWYSDGVDNDGDGTIDEDDDGGPPNVVYIESDLTLNGNVGTIGGFYVVVGDVITNPAGTYDASINGNGQVNGVIYTLGTFSVNGGGGGLNVSGGVWSGEEVELNGNANITYNKDYMDAIEDLDINPGVQIDSWRETQGPYKLSP